MNKKQSICEVDRKNNSVFENTYSMMIVSPWCTMCMKLANSYKLVSFNVVVVTTYKRCHTVTTKLTNLCCLKTDET
ncbi:MULTISPECIES: hypothetical protein [Bacillus cereus group]|uniref:hypothetical protein n=1 Tax=Bacillus cereus group TaxID=86661 RepID=UPI000BEB527E|nr:MULTISPECIES: hypothetical protein [Bacillus cereus group]KAA0828028.1 hypothetical protein DN403_10210 [Bacillus sp. AY2-1]PDZ88803.1 hypothetical protein CON47_26515 [Bacillus thuringiensis]PGL51920.1 hypothetical protein CN914_05175 [Bacillus thuringiensis]